MAFTRFASTPSDGLKNTSSFATTPSSETAARKQIQDIVDQMNACGNALEAELEASTAAAEIGCILGGIASNLQALIALVEASGIGSIPLDDTITDAQMATDCKIGTLTAGETIVTKIATLIALTITKTAIFNNINTQLSGLITPSKIEHFAFGSLPSGYLLANGQAVSRSTYSALFSAIGTTYGTGDGSTTFNVPDLTATSTMQVCIKT